MPVDPNQSAVQQKGNLSQVVGTDKKDAEKRSGTARSQRSSSAQKKIAENKKDGNPPPSLLVLSETILLRRQPTVSVLLEHRTSNRFYWAFYALHNQSLIGKKNT